MKKKVLSLLVAAVMIISALALCGCYSDNNSDADQAKKFGEFAYYGKYLVDYAKTDITVAEAKALVENNAKTQTAFNSSVSLTNESVISGTSSGNSAPAPASDRIEKLLNQYKECEINTYYYTNEKAVKQESRNSTIQGMSLRNMLEKNEYTPFDQLIAKYILIDSDIIDYMEKENAAFKNSSNATTAPFTDIYSYCKDARGNLVIKIKDYAELPAVVNGGINCTFRQDIEIVYDADNKVQKWQTSLGIIIATPDKNPIKQGYILKTDFTWEIKD